MNCLPPALHAPDPSPGTNRRACVVAGGYVCDFTVTRVTRRGGRVVLRLRLVPGSCTYKVRERTEVMTTYTFDCLPPNEARRTIEITAATYDEAMQRATNMWCRQMRPPRLVKSKPSWKDPYPPGCEYLKLGLDDLGI